MAPTRLCSRATLFRISTAFLVAPAAAGCGSEPDYFPLADGVEWEYRVEGDDGSPPFTYIRRADGVRAIDGRSYVRMVLDGAPAGYLSEYFVRSDEKGTYERADGIPEYLTLAKPLTIGATWTTTDGGRLTVEGIESVTVPGGTFTDCYRVKSVDDHGDGAVNHYCPGVGVVRTEISAGPSTIVEQLVRYSKEKPKPAAPAATAASGGSRTGERELTPELALQAVREWAAQSSECTRYVSITGVSSNGISRSGSSALMDAVVEGEWKNTDRDYLGMPMDPMFYGGACAGFAARNGTRQRVRRDLRFTLFDTGWRLERD